MDTQQASKLQCSLGRRRLPDYDQVESRVVEFPEQILDRSIGPELEQQPGKAIARARCAAGQASDRLRQRAVAIMYANLGDDPERDFLYSADAQRNGSDPGENLGAKQAGKPVVRDDQPERPVSRLQ